MVTENRKRVCEIPVIVYIVLGCLDADLQCGVTDSGLHMLASAGCGSKLTSLALISE